MPFLVTNTASSALGSDSARSRRSIATANSGRTMVMDGLGIGAHVALSQGHAEEAVDLALQAIEQADAHGLVDLPHAGYYSVALGAAMARCGR
ncbi:MAG TPA: hypothetical protein VF165_09905, partial [Nocardioidaceae bacterium]